MNTQNYAVNIRVGLANPARVNISQGDTGRTLAFSLYDGLSPFTPPTGSTVTIVGRKPSKLGFSEACTVSGNVATVATTLAMTQEAGKFPAELRIEAGGQSIGTANFTMYVEPSPHPDGTTDGTHATVDNLQTQIGDLSNLETTAKTDLVSAINEAAQSGGVVIDDTLTQTGQAADAKKTGDEISAIKADLASVVDSGNIFDVANSSMKKFNINYNSGVVSESLYNVAICIPVTPNTIYTIDIPNATRSRVVENSTPSFTAGTAYNVVYNPNQHDGDGHYPITFTVGADMHYVLIDVLARANYDYETNKGNISMSVGSSIRGDIIKSSAILTDPTLSNPQMPAESKAVGDAIRFNNLNDANVLVFGDSISDATTYAYDTSKESSDGTSLTTAVCTKYFWKPIAQSTKSYVKDGNTIRFFHWPKLIKDAVGFKEIRCYAKSGAYYHTITRPTEDANWKPTLNLQCQIDLAINDCNTHNTVVGSADFSPDIIIFALGTNDLLLQNVGSFEEAMAETVYQADGYSCDVSATINAIDDSTSIGSARKAFLRVKQAFPTAQIFVVMPTERTRYDFNQGTFRTELIKMANWYNAIIIDATYESGIVKDIETNNEVGVLTIDGLHPNEIGQNMLAGLIANTLKTKYVQLYRDGYNQEGGYIVS